MFWFSESELGSSVDVVGLELLEASSDPLEARGPSFRLRFKKLPLVKTLCLKNQKVFFFKMFVVIKIRFQKWTLFLEKQTLFIIFFLIEMFYNAYRA